MTIKITRNMQINSFSFIKGEVWSLNDLIKKENEKDVENDYEKTEFLLEKIIEFLINSGHAIPIKENLFNCKQINVLKEEDFLCEVCNCEIDCNNCIFNDITEEDYIKLIQKIDENIPKFINKLVSDYVKTNKNE